MRFIDYKKYSMDELLDARAHINAEKYPGTYKALIDELESRKEHIDEYLQDRHEKQITKANKRVKLVGYCQILSALTIFILLVIMVFRHIELSLLTLLSSSFLIVLNSTAGYTAIKGKYQWYGLSIFNLMLQIPSFAIGHVLVNYSGIGGIYGIFHWGNRIGLTLHANLSPGFKLQRFNEVLPDQFLAIDILAIFFIVALLTAQTAKQIKDEQHTHLNKESGN